MDDADLRRVNLLECLEEERPALASLLPPESVLSTWSDDELRAFFASDGARRPEKRDASVAGGARDARFMSSEDELAAARSGAMNVDITRPEYSAARYREVAFARGIPFRRNGLFPLNDPALSKLSNDPRLKPLQKHFPIDHPPFYECVGGCWATGDDAAASGLDLRYFYDDVNKSLSAVVRFGDGAAIARGKGTSAHGGSIETALDETTAEVVKCAVAPQCATTSLTAKIKKPVELHTTYVIECVVKPVPGSGKSALDESALRVLVEATMRDAETNAVVATCEATLANISAFNRARR